MIVFMLFILIWFSYDSHLFKFIFIILLNGNHKAFYDFNLVPFSTVYQADELTAMINMLDIEIQTDQTSAILRSKIY
jgi:hypothetical protein